ILRWVLYTQVRYFKGMLWIREINIPLKSITGWEMLTLNVMILHGCIFVVTMVFILTLRGIIKRNRCVNSVPF
ncbi:hypothetical protein ASV53_01665, partial [Photobacterium sanguinicancri]